MGLSFRKRYGEPLYHRRFFNTAKLIYNFIKNNFYLLDESGKKGWTEITSSNDSTKRHRTFRRKSSGQVVDYHYKCPTKRNMIADEHYHWNNPSYTKKMGKMNKYIDRYGRLCNDKSRESHLAPLDKKYIFK